METIIKEKVYFADNGYVTHDDIDNVFVYEDDKKLGNAIGETLVQTANDKVVDYPAGTSELVIGFAYEVRVKLITRKRRFI
jgi:hypothetical protein